MRAEDRPAGSRVTGLIGLLAVIAGIVTIVACVGLWGSDTDNVFAPLAYGVPMVACIFLGFWALRRVQFTSPALVALDRRFAEDGVRGTARILAYEAPAHVPPSARLVWLVLTLTLELPEGTRNGLRYRALVPGIDLPRFTTLGRMPCVVTPDEPPNVRVYPRCDADIDVLQGEPLTLIPYAA
ncbi:hypothetical protein Val02_45410 [Virgisporangium aliadipatigenens]|uniref:Uncharacterized protein n=1 Tax=Virgisporangium aliadipatigenens TaxID=741659 RepID=A0A8J3YPI4_9ACTN|nr:hypothetical protein [Virgisporangium aliadipatigenens]GIJ47655.1 hypothetical protein Val02_45410 [Virgisporangium aliadipatigenens]